MTIVFVFRSGKEIEMECESFSVTTDFLTGSIIEYEATGITKNKPSYINVKEIDMIYKKGEE